MQCLHCHWFPVCTKRTVCFQPELAHESKVHILEGDICRAQLWQAPRGGWYSSALEVVSREDGGGHGNEQQVMRLDKGVLDGACNGMDTERQLTGWMQLESNVWPPVIL